MINKEKIEKVWDEFEWDESCENISDLMWWFLPLSGLYVVVRNC